MKTKPGETDEFFEVTGAGKLALGPYVARCGRAVGPSLEVSWTQHGYCGGVIDHTEVKRLHQFLTKWLEDHGKNLPATESR